VRALKAWREGRPPFGRALVFGTSSDRPDGLNNLTKRRLRKLEDKAGIPPYGGLRHYRISSWLQAGLEPAHVQKLAGHAALALTLSVYADLIPRGDDHRRVVDAELG
jgi:integrase